MSSDMRSDYAIKAAQKRFCVYGDNELISETSDCTHCEHLVRLYGDQYKHIDVMVLTGNQLPTPKQYIRQNPLWARVKST